MRHLSDEQIGRLVAKARALADVTRIRILDALGSSELSVGSIASALDAEPSTISKHLQVLFRAGLVDRRRAASKVSYSITDARLTAVFRDLARASKRFMRV
jgi:DNA-binding transcriptional ArsR family regulator